MSDQNHVRVGFAHSGVIHMTTKPKEIDSYLKIPMIVGVAGHEEIVTPETQIEEAMKLFWKHLKDIVPNTHFILLANMAEGANRLAIKYRPKDKDFCVDYCAVLPFEQSEYEKKFSTQSELDEFRDYLNGAYNVITLQPPQDDDSAATEFIRRHSDFLLTLWDGQKSLDSLNQAEKHSTYYQIRSAFKLDDILVEHQEKKHAVVNIRVERKRGHSNNEMILLDTPAPAPAPEVLLKQDSTTGMFSTLPFQEWPNKDSSRKAAEKASAMSIEIAIDDVVKHNSQKISDTDKNNLKNNFLYKELINATANNPDLQDEIIGNCARFSFFDNVAGEHQGKFRRDFRAIAILSFLAGFFGQLWGDATFWSNEVIHERVLHGVMGLYLLGCFATGAVFLCTKKNNHYTKYIYPRVIAELMRLRIFWSIARIPQRFFVSVLGEDTDYRFSLFVCNWEIEEEKQKDADLNSMNRRMDLVKEKWIEDQIKYYKNRSKEYERRDTRFKRLKRFLFWMPFVLAAILLLIFFTVKDHCGFLKLSYYREFIIGICPFLVSTIGWLLEKNNWDAQANEYRRMIDFFEKALNVMKKKVDEKPKKTGEGATEDGSEPPPLDEATKQKLQWDLIHEKQKYIRKLMEISRDENSDWQEIKHRSGEPEPMF